ncbi:MAG: hypothetical protein RDU59_02840 [Thermodesulfobacteriota bacterium]|nr:hypothetical protein [Thermodesulfobacteriota bacterium]
MKDTLITLAICIFLTTNPVYAGTYLDSAHGNTSYGVSRTSTSSVYTKGHCAHCHEQHASIEGVEPDPTGGPDKWLVFTTLYTDQDTGLCLSCHAGSSSQVGMPNQYTFSYKFGGDTSLTCPSSIAQAFSFITEGGVPQSTCGSTTGSSHQLTAVRTFLKSKWGFGATNPKVNPCSGCHNPHRAQRHSYPSGSAGTSPLSRPTTHDGDWNVYGAATNERMSNYVYQAPYSSGSATTYEPDGTVTLDGSNMPDYVTFCTDCHNASYSTGQMTSSQKSQFATVGAQPYIRSPNWTTSPHGQADASMDATKRKAPYTADKNYVLSCTDCHEAHGSPNRMLIRKEINGSSVVTFDTWNDRDGWFTVCQRCHTIDSGHKGSNPCYVCHQHDTSWFKPI